MSDLIEDVNAIAPEVETSDNCAHPSSPTPSRL